jgi:hypothetical protein
VVLREIAKGYFEAIELLWMKGLFGELWFGCMGSWERAVVLLVLCLVLTLHALYITRTIHNISLGVPLT